MRSKIVEAARKYRGVRFLHQGRSPEFGLDCIGLITQVARDLGLFNYDCVNYTRAPEPGLLISHLEKVFIPITDWQSGDLLVFNIKHTPRHVGIVDGDWFIHTHASAGAVVRESLSNKWRKRIFTAFKYPGVDK